MKRKPMMAHKAFLDSETLDSKSRRKVHTALIILTFAKYTKTEAKWRYKWDMINMGI